MSENLAASGLADLKKACELDLCEACGIDSSRLPRHVAIIMDGNGRWAKKRGLSRTAGHKEGLQSAKRIARAAARLGIKFVTLYTFSTENWKRAESEVGYLMGLIKTHLRAEFDFYKENQIRIAHIGNMEGLPQEIQTEIKEAIRETKDFAGTTAVLAVNYGGKDEICRAANKMLAKKNSDFDAGKKIATEAADAENAAATNADTKNSDAAATKTAAGPAKSGKGENASAQFSEADFARFLDLPELPDVDLLIRTGGEKRLSNFLLWQAAYAELVFHDTLWPDYTTEDFFSDVKDFALRERRFGGVRSEEKIE